MYIFIHYVIAIFIVYVIVVSIIKNFFRKMMKNRKKKIIKKEERKWEEQGILPKEGTKRMKVEFLVNRDLDILKEEIERFAKWKEIIDIKFNSEMGQKGFGSCFYYSVMILYYD